jgi:hypothetical protein
MKRIFMVFVLLLILVCSQSFAQDSSIALKNSCVKQQLNDHKGIKNHPAHAADFESYCKCESEFIVKNSNNDQLAELKNKPKIMPKWLEELQGQAMKSCLNISPKVSS